MLNHHLYPGLDELMCTVDGRRLYHAGLPGFPRLFPRDLFFSAFLFRDAEFLRDVISFAASQQGSRKDPFTGEEPGKVIHEVPGITFTIDSRKYSTAYNASDTTPAFLIGLSHYLRMTGDKGFVLGQKGAAQKSLDYVLSHLDRDAVFWEDPARVGAERFALRSTYWKDAMNVPGREGGLLRHPVAYALLQAIVAASLRAASELGGLLGFDSAMLEERASRAASSLWTTFWDDEKKYLAMARDQVGLIPGLSSDCLHALYYLRPEDVPREKLEQIIESSKLLETPYGYRTLVAGEEGFSPESYHLGSIWPFEQAFIAEAGRIHGRPELSRVAEGVMDALAGGKPGGYPETLRWEAGMAQPEITGKSCHTQLWTIACHYYFSAPEERTES